MEVIKEDRIIQWFDEIKEKEEGDEFYQDAVKKVNYLERRGDQLIDLLISIWLRLPFSKNSYF